MQVVFLLAGLESITDGRNDLRHSLHSFPVQQISHSAIEIYAH
jgi:hypothetical protein